MQASLPVMLSPSVSVLYGVRLSNVGLNALLRRDVGALFGSPMAIGFALSISAFALDTLYPSLAVLFLDMSPNW